MGEGEAKMLKIDGVGLIAPSPPKNAALYPTNTTLHAHLIFHIEWMWC